MQKKTFLNYWRALLSLGAFITTVIAVALWYFDGAWEYGSMTTRGVVWTALFAGGAMACFLASTMIARLHGPR